MSFRRIAVLVIALPTALSAQASNTVPLQNPVYRDLDRLFGNGVIESMLVGQRPYTRREIARIIAGARVAAGDSADEFTTATLRRLFAEFARDIAALGDSAARHPAARFTDARGEVLGTSAAGRAIPSRPVGKIDARIAPLLDERAGAVFRDGTNAAFDAGFEVTLPNALAFQARPRFIANQNAGATFAAGEVRALSATLLVRNVAIEAGRDQFVWGQGFRGGLLGSSSGRPLDMIRIFNDTLSRWPLVSWLFHADRVRGTLMAADLGPSQDLPHAKIIAYKLSGNPGTSRFELSASVLAELGGRGAPRASLRDRFIDLVPILQYTLPAESKSHDQISNKFAGWEYRLRIPEWSGLQLYAEHQFDDMDPRRWWSTLWEDGGHVAGASLARLGGARAWSAAAEFHHTGLRYYEHNVWSSGVTFDQTLIGDPLGPQGNAGYLRVRRSRGGPSDFELTLGAERRSGDIYDAQEEGVPPHETNFHFVLLKRGDPEWRHRATAEWDYRPSPGRRLQLVGGYERIRNFNFAAGAERGAFLLNAAMEFYPGR